MKEDEISPPPAFTGLPMAWCPPPTHTPTRGAPGPRAPVPAPYLGAGGRAEPSRTVTGASQTATAEQGQPLWHWASALGQLDTGTVPGRNPSHGPVMSPTRSAVPARHCCGGEQWGCGVCTPCGCPQHQLPVPVWVALWGGTPWCKGQRARVMLSGFPLALGGLGQCRDFLRPRTSPLGCPGTVLPC